jgi:hypothetical protein
MKPAIYVLACSLLGYVVSPCSSIAQDIAGSWQNTEFLGLANVGNKCSYITVRDYRYLFSPEQSGQRLVSFSVAETKSWVTITDLDCAFPGENSDQRTYLRILQWDGLARPVGSSRWEVGTGPGRCSVQGCGEVPYLAPLGSEIQLRDSTLFDKRTGLPPELPPLPFRSLDVAEKLASDAASAAPELMKRLDEGNCFNWYQTAWSARAIDPAKIPALCALEKQFQQSTGDVLETRVIGSWTLGRDPRQASANQENIVLIAAAAVFGNGANLGRVVVLIQEGSSWRILSRLGR